MLVALLLLGVLIVPLLSLKFGQEDVGVTPKSTTQRQAFDLLSAGFGPGYNGPLLIATELVPPAKPSAAYTKKYNHAQALKKDIDTKKKSLEQQKKELQHQQAQLEKQQSQLQAQANQLKRKKAALQKQQASLLRQKKALERQEASLRAKKASLEAQKASLERQKAALEAQARQLAAQARVLGRRLLVLKARERHLERAIARAKRPERKRVLKQRLAEVRQEERTVRNQLAALKSQAIQLGRQARSLAAQARELNAEAAQLQQQANVLTAQANELRRQGNALKRQAKQLKRQKKQLQAQAASLQQQANELQRQANQLKKQKKQLQAEANQAKQLKAQLTKELTKAGGDDWGTDPRIVKLQNGLSGAAGVARLTPPQINKSGDSVIMNVIATTRPAADATAALVVRLRVSVIPDSIEEGGISAFVGGFTASYVDLASKIAARLPIVILTVIGLSFIVLMIAFRSLLVPVQAAVTNLLSVAAAFGVLTATFQWGWGLGLVGVSSPYGTVTIASYVPLMMFAVLFGLSMDYEVFLMSRVVQHKTMGESPRLAVQSGVDRAHG